MIEETDISDTMQRDYIFFDRQRSGSDNADRFMSPDPLGGNVGNPQTLDRYAYVGNEPMGSVDPSGLTGKCRNMGGCPQPIDFGGGTNNDELLSTDFFLYYAGFLPVEGALGLAGNINALMLLVPYPAGEGGGGGGYSSPLGSLSTQKFGCPSVPAHPANASIFANVEAAQSNFFGTNIDPLSRFDNANLYLYEQFRTGGPQDYKQLGSQYASFGNFNYGAVCGAMGFSLGYCQNAAGVAHVKLVLERNLEYYLGFGKQPYAYGGAGVPFLQSPYGDQPADSAEIAGGYFFQANCIN